MRLRSYISERTSLYGAGITFLDIDETILKTRARVKIMKDGEVVARLRNHEYLKWTPKEGESADFSEYSDADVFYKTSDPIMPVIKRIQKMFKGIRREESNSRIVIVSGREDLTDKSKFLDTFRKFGVPIDDIYVERCGNMPDAVKNLPKVKKQVIFKYLSTGLYRRARLLDDSTANCLAFLELEEDMPEPILKMMREKYSIPEGEPVIDFYALKVLKDGSLQRITRK
jgi:hypothetical protein